ncbi:uncharacterized protein C5orf34 homolog [Stigmatopora argus]
MEAEVSFSRTMMIMYEDESVDIRYGNGTQLQLSPCGSEFMLVKGSVASGHAHQIPTRVRQRTRFTISAYKEFILSALAFRNKYASQPYLPKELFIHCRKQPLQSINMEVEWPSLSSCEAEIGPENETIIKSEDKRNVLTLSPSGEEFFVDYECRFSQIVHQQPQHLKIGIECSQNKQQSPIDDIQNAKKLSLQTITNEAKPEEKYQSITVVQHFSCHTVAPPWCYPLSLARHHWTARASIPSDCQKEKTRNSKTDQMPNTTDLGIEARRFRLPQALPLICPSPHLHRFISWKYPDPITPKQPSQNFLNDLVKVMWCQGVTYRILEKDVPLIEVSPGDGSVIRSNGVLNMYFTHYKPEYQLGQTNVKEVTYHVNGLPPDIPGQLYSISSIVSWASSLLGRYQEAKNMRIMATPSCLIQHNVFQPTMINGNLTNPSSFSLHNNDKTIKSRENATVMESRISEVRQRTSKEIQDIDMFLTAARNT